MSKIKSGKNSKKKQEALIRKFFSRDQKKPAEGEKMLREFRAFIIRKEFPHLLKEEEKIILKKLSLIRLSKKAAIAIAFAAVFAAAGFVLLDKINVLRASTFGWVQTTWTGGADTVNFPDHTNNQTGWTKFYSKDAEIDTNNDELKMTQTSGNYTETDDASGFSAGTKSNTYSSGTGVLIKKNDGVSCTTAQTTDYECTTGNCDGDFSSGNYCHATASSCVNFALGTPWERADGYELCSGNSYYKSCANSVWGAQQNCDTNNAYCDAGGGEQSGWRTGQTCSSGLSGGCQTPSCTSCSPYIAASTFSCKTSCTVNGDCWSGKVCSGNACIDPWISGYCGVQVYYADISGVKQWKTSNTNCDTPQCGINGGQDGDNLVASNTVDFSLYPARDACKTLGGRLPTKTELLCIFTNKANLGSFQNDKYWSATEYNDTIAWPVSFFDGSSNPFYNKTEAKYVRCVR